MQVNCVRKWMVPWRKEKTRAREGGRGAMGWEGAPCSMKWGESGQASLRKEHLMRHWKEVTSGVRAFQASQQLEPRAGGWRAGGGL